MSTKREELIAIIEAKYPKLNLRTTEEFDGEKGGIWVAGTENGIEAKDGFPLFNYYNENHSSTRYEFGVHKEIRKILDTNGWYGSWHDAGTLMIWES
jgi:hypothetical protein